MSIRQATHAGSWYTERAERLNNELSTWLAQANPGEADGFSFPVKGCKAIIAPHAGYSYSGPPAAWAYKSIDTTGIKRVFILGPAHNVYMDSCALSKCREYATPLGNIPLDLSTIEELRNTGLFSSMSIETDEEEHSIEMHIPYVRKVFQGIDIKIVPVLVGSINKDKEKSYGSILAPYFAREDTFCVVSSDFCHWGERFQFTHYYPTPPSSPTDTSAGVRLSHRTANSTISNSFPIYKSIEALDHQAMDILTIPPATGAEAHDTFASYIAKTKNTICGRHPIGVLLGALAELENTNGTKGTIIKWVRYAQSSQCVNMRDSSVSYASAYVVF